MAVAKQEAVAVADTLAPPTAGSSYLEWGAVFGGSAFAAAMSIVLLQFGTGIGLSLGSPTLPDGSASWNVLVAGLWVVAVAVSSAAAGGYIAGRMRSRWGDAVEAEVEFRDGAHGLVVWAVSTMLAGLMIALISAFPAIGAAAMAGATEAEPTADMLRIGGNVTAIFAFATAAGAALGAAAAWFAATTGGQHRDEGVSMHEVVPKSFRK